MSSTTCALTSRPRPSRKLAPATSRGRDSGRAAALVESGTWLTARFHLRRTRGRSKHGEVQLCWTGHAVKQLRGGLAGFTGVLPRPLAAAKPQSFAPDGRRDGTGAAFIAVLAQINPLPGAERQPPVTDGDGRLRPQQHGLDVGGHVVVALGRVLQVRSSVRNGLVEPPPQIRAHLRIGILVERE